MLSRVVGLLLYRKIAFEARTIRDVGRYSTASFRGAAFGN